VLATIFGAGATYDSLPDTPPAKGAQYPNRPPLAKELFEHRFGYAIDNYPACRPLVHHLRQLASGASLEEELDSITRDTEGNPGDPRLRRQLAAIRFYLQEIISTCTEAWSKSAHGITNYSILVDQVEKWAWRRQGPVVWVNFNYDTLLEQGLNDVIGFRANEIGNYLDFNRHTVIKPHGSVNWAHVAQDPGDQAGYQGSGSWIAGKMIDRLPYLMISEQILITPPGVFSRNGQGLYPALTIPIREKAAFECPTMHIKVMSDALKQTDRLLIVGWAGNEGTFLKICRNNLSPTCRIQIVSGSAEAAAGTAHALEAAGVKGEMILSENGFTKYLAEGELGDLLK
jgi:hypothetical protein